LNPRSIRPLSPKLTLSPEPPENYDANSDRQLDTLA
jgi:hypothetical protein